MGLRDSKVKVYEEIPLTSQRAVINAGKPSLEELDWAI